mgnify:FL=1
MTFSGRVEEVSHMRGLLVSFEGRSPNLGDTIRVRGGKILGRVDTVIGPVDSGLVHIHPVSRGVEVDRAIGSPVEIAPRRARDKRGGNRHRDGRNTNRNEIGRSRDDGKRSRGSNNNGRRGDSRKKSGAKRGRNPRYDGRGSRKNSRGRGRK